MKDIDLRTVISVLSGVVAKITSQLEESADVLRRRVELLEAEASAKPAVDHEAFAALGEEMKAATAVGARLREQVPTGRVLFSWLAISCWKQNLSP